MEDSYLFGVVLMQLSLTAVASPQAEDFGFGAVGHVDDAFEPPAFDDGPADGPQDQTVFAYLKKAQVAAGVGAHLNGETVTVHLPRCERLQIDVIAPLKKKKQLNQFNNNQVN